MLKLFYTVVFAAIVQVSFCQGFDFDGMNQTDSLGRKQGYWVYSYPDNKIKSIDYYSNGKLDKTSYSFYSNGRLESIIEFNKGVKDGVYKVFGENGNLEMFILLENGKRKYLNKYNEDGDVFYKELYEKGKVVKTFVYENGDIIEGFSEPPSKRKH